MSQPSSAPAPSHRHALLRVLAVFTGGLVTLGGLVGLAGFGFALFACGYFRGHSGPTAPASWPPEAPEVRPAPPQATADAGAD